MFGRSWVRFLSGTQILSLSHARVIVDYFIFQILFLFISFSSLTVQMEIQAESSDTSMLAMILAANELEKSELSAPLNNYTFSSVFYS